MREALERGLPVVGDIELFAREARAPIAAITGTNGKSTVTTLVAELANAGGRRAVAGGNLGEPALDLLERPAPELYVLELSSFQLETTHSLRTVTATVLNVTPDHMDRYASLEAYAAAKARIFDGCDVAVINADDPVVRGMPRPGQSVVSFSLESRDADYTLERLPAPMIVRRGEPLLPLAAMRLQGLHNAANAMAALAMAEALELPLAPALDALCAFGGLPHRSQWVADVRGVRYVNDSKGTNVGATLAAVRGLAGPLVVIAGGDGKNQDFSELRRCVPRQGPSRRADRPRCAGARSRRWPASAPRSAPATCRRPCVRRRPSRNRATPCCSRRPARASTCSATTAIAATNSPPPSGVSLHERAGFHRQQLRAFERPAAPPAAGPVDHRHRVRAAADRPDHGRVGLDRHLREGDRRGVPLLHAPAGLRGAGARGRLRRAGRADAHLGRVFEVPAGRRVPAAGRRADSRHRLRGQRHRGAGSGSAS